MDKNVNNSDLNDESNTCLCQNKIHDGEMCGVHITLLFMRDSLVYSVISMTELHFDLCVIGGGINGAGIARDAAGRGLSVLLVEAQDLAGATSSASSKLIHGGIRYLEHFQFKMVHDALREREILLRNAPHLIRPIEFVLPHDGGQRPEWMLKIGLFLYDRLGGRSIMPRSRAVDLSVDTVGKPLKEQLLSGFVYSDCWGDDTRLVVLNAVDAAARNACILTHTQCQALKVENGRWTVGLCDLKTGRFFAISAAMVVNATGPWVGEFLERTGLSDNDHDVPKVRLVKGSHLILPRQYEGEQAYILQQPDKRIVFVMPYEGKYTLIGTTEEECKGDPREAMASDAEIAYLLAAYNRAFKNAISKDDLVFTYSGVRPLFDDGTQNASAVTRDYRIYHHKRYAPPMLSVFGGKLTTYRIVAESVVDKLMQLSGRHAGHWTANTHLTGGDIPHGDIAGFRAAQKMRYPWLPYDLLSRYVRMYGSRMDYFLYRCEQLADLGLHYGDDLYDVEIAYLRQYEWARCAEDILWRRSKLGLHLSDKTIHNLEQAFS